MTKTRCAVVVALALVSAHPVLAMQSPGADPADLRYRIAANDVLVVKYRYSPEYDYTVAVPPDGIVTLPIVGEMQVGALTVSETQDAIRRKASQRLREPEVTVELKEFQHPRFIVGGEVGAPGQFDLRGRVTVLEAIAIAGGFKPSAKHSQIVLFRRYDADHVFTRVLNAKELARPAERVEGLLLAPGDFLLVPQNRLSKVQSIVPLAGLAWLVNPFLGLR
jgi:polysaccharide export outer membrane protein